MPAAPKKTATEKTAMAPTVRSRSLTVRQLLDVLLSIPLAERHKPVLMSSDPEGNQLYTLHEVATDGTDFIIWPGEVVSDFE